MRGWSVVGLLVSLSWVTKGQVLVDTKYGPVEGHTVDLSDGSHVNSFLGIPFAKPPVANLRWQPPEEPDPWSLFVADTMGASCIQNRFIILNVTHPDWDNLSEDCLTLNIYTPPDISPLVPYPVMVFLHGGAFYYGGNIMYAAHFLTRNDVVIVIPNYRLNIFGFASTGNGLLPGNYGLLDQILALQFVQENIAQFGGDPDSVTIFGESAGAASVGHMMMSPLAQGMFHRAVLQSGSELHSFAMLQDSSPTAGWLNTTAARLDCASEDMAAVVDCLRQVDAWSLFLAPCVVCLWLPVVDGYVLPALPQDIRESGQFAKVSVLTGNTQEDGFYFVVGVNNTNPGLEQAQFESRILSRAQSYAGSGSPPEVVDDINQALLWYYSPWPDLQDQANNLYQWGMLETDTLFGMDQDLQAKLHTDHADTYFFVFGYRSENEDTPEWKALPLYDPAVPGAEHASDIPYVFGYPHLQDNPAVRNDSLMFAERMEYTQDDKDFTDFMMKLWTNFAIYDNPTPSPVALPQGGEIMWGEFTNQDLQYLYMVNEESEMRDNYRQRDYAFWQDYLPKIKQGEN